VFFYPFFQCKCWLYEMRIGIMKRWCCHVMCLLKHYKGWHDTSRVTAPMLPQLSQVTSYCCQFGCRTSCSNLPLFADWAVITQTICNMVNAEGRSVWLLQFMQCCHVSNRVSELIKIFIQLCFYWLCYSCHHKLWVGKRTWKNCTQYFSHRLLSFIFICISVYLL